jgi:hypothetical protein
MKRGGKNAARKNPYQTPIGQKREKYRQAKLRNPKGGYPFGFAK